MRLIVVYFDTSVLVYFSIDQDIEKLRKARDVIFEAVEKREFFLSPLVISEYIFVLSKLKILSEQKEKVQFFMQFIQTEIDKEIVEDAFMLCEQLQMCKNINDAIHFVIASRYCQKIVTFDKDYKKLKNSTIEIEIL